MKYLKSIDNCSFVYSSEILVPASAAVVCFCMNVVPRSTMNTNGGTD